MKFDSNGLSIPLLPQGCLCAEFVHKQNTAQSLKKLFLTHKTARSYCNLSTVRSRKLLFQMKLRCSFSAKNPKFGLNPMDSKLCFS